MLKLSTAPFSFPNRENEKTKQNVPENINIQIYSKFKRPFLGLNKFHFFF